MNEYTYDQLHIGHTEQFSTTITQEMENQFRMITGDVNPMHADDVFAREISGERFRSHIIFGMLTASLYSTLAGVYLPGKYSLIHSLDNLGFLGPVFAEDRLTISGTVKDKNDDLHIICVSAKVKNQHGIVVSKAKLKIIVQK